MVGASDVSALAFSPKGAFFALGDSDGDITIWSYSTMVVMVKTLELQDGLVAGESVYEGKRKTKKEKQLTELRYVKESLSCTITL